MINWILYRSLVSWTRIRILMHANTHSFTYRHTYLHALLGVHIGHTEPADCCRILRDSGLVLKCLF